MNRFFPVTLFALIVSALLMQSCSPDPSAAGRDAAEIVDSGTPPVHVEGFELRYVGLEPKSYPFFDVGYAIWANYPYFTYAGDTYERAGVGGVVIRRNVVRPTRYVVTETLGGSSPVGEPRKSTLTIMDKETHALVAHRTLLQGEIENRKGWVGQHAAEFVRRNLLTDESIGLGGVGAKPYPRVPVEIKPLKMKALSIRDSGCGSTISLPLRMPPATLDTPQWRFLPQAPISDFACSEGYILVLSNIYPNDLFLDVLTEDGTYVFQTEIDNPAWVDSGRIKVKLDDVSLSASGAEFSLMTLKAVQNGKATKWSAERHVHIHMPFENHSAR